MSHFAVLVVTDTPNEDELEKVLQPYHEYECTGVDDEYVVFVDHHDEFMEEWATKKVEAYRGPDGKIYGYWDEILYRDSPTGEKEWEGSSRVKRERYVPFQFLKTKVHLCEVYDLMETYAEEEYGYTVENGRWGERTNPNAQWDWWVIGGRWSGFFKTKEGAGVKGKPGLMGSEYDAEGKDQCLKSEIDVESRMDKAGNEAAVRYDEVSNIIAGRSFKTWEECREECKNDMKKARSLFYDQDVIKDLKEYDVWIEPESYICSRADYIEKARANSITTFAVLYKGEWIERGSMGWWGCVSDKKDDNTWTEEFMTIWNDIPDNKYVTVVDCHI